MRVTRVQPQGQDMWLRENQVPGLGWEWTGIKGAGDSPGKTPSWWGMRTGKKGGSFPASSACEKPTLLEASMNLTPLYVIDRMMVGIFFMCSVDFYRG